MKRHLTERQLIEYRFKLACEPAMEGIAGHLQDCAGCRDALEGLNRRFAALDLLREEVEVSEELISQVVDNAGRPAQTKVVSFKMPAWIGAAAAVILMGSLVLVSEFGKDSAKREGRSTEKPDLTTGFDLKRHVPKGSTSLPEASMPGELDEFAAAVQTPSRQPGKIGSEAAESIGDGTAGAIVEDQIPEQPPFAPASAIELVILPRRESVQLTIYNSTVRSLPIQGGYGGRYGSYGGYGGGPYGGYARPVNVELPGGYGRANLDEAALGKLQERARRSRPAEGAPVMAAGDLTLVRDRRNLTLKKGWNWLQLMWANTLIDPTSLHLEPLAHKDKIDIQQLVFPSRLRELGRWLIRSDVGGQVPFEITYFTSGLSWRAFYMGTLSADEQKMKLQSYVRLENNSGEDYENAQTRLIVGQIHLLDQIAELAGREFPYGRPGVGAPDDAIRKGGYGGAKYNWTNGYAMGMGRYGGGGYGGAFSHQPRPKEIVKEGLSEYFLYTIEGTETIPDKWGKRLLSFDQDDIEVESLYKYDEGRYGAQTVRFVSFANDDDHNLGNTPIPNGDVKIYGRADSDGYLSYVGGASIKYIPVDEEVELNLGPARLVSVEPTLMDLRTANYLFDRDRNIIGWDEIRTWKMEITNTRTLPVEIEITRGFGTAYWTLKADVPHEKHDVASTRFELTVQPRTKRTFSYTVTTYHGVREEQVNE